MKNFIVVDAAMNDLLRPSLYDAYHEILPVDPCESDDLKAVDVVGPVCETGDILGESRYLPFSENLSGLFVVKDCGAYGATMSSNYNSRPFATEVFVESGKVRVIRERQSVEEIWAPERKQLDSSWEEIK